MFWKKKYKLHDEPFDRAAKSIIRAAGIGEDKADDIASSPFLYGRLRARIEAERATQAGPIGGWFENFKIARRAVVALACVALIALGSLWVAGRNNNPVTSPGVIEPIAYQASPVSACALSATDECAVSNEEVLATMFAEQKRKE